MSSIERPGAAPSTVETQEGFWHKVDRELDLLGVGFKAIPAAAKEELTQHPLETGVKLAAAVGLGVAASFLTRSTAPLPMIVQTFGIGIGVASIGSGLGRTGSALLDNWHSADNWKTNVDVMQHNFAPFAFDTGLSLVGSFAGGIAGQKLYARSLRTQLSAPSPQEILDRARYGPAYGRALGSSASDTVEPWPSAPAPIESAIPKAQPTTTAESVMVTPRAAAPIESAVAGSQPALIESAIVKSAESTLPETGKAAAYEPQLPPFTKAGFLPPGTHSVTWQEFVDRYGWNDKRVNLLDGMRSLFGELKKQGGGDEVYVGGSFVTTKELPNDFDATWDVSGPQLGELGKKAAILSDRTLQAKTYGGQLMANYPNSPDGGILSWLQRSRTGTEIGVVKLDLSTLPIN